MSWCPDCQTDAHTQKCNAILGTQTSHETSYSTSETKYTAYVPSDWQRDVIERRQEVATTSGSQKSYKLTNLADRIIKFSVNQLSEFERKHPIYQSYNEPLPDEVPILTAQDYYKERRDIFIAYAGLLSPFISLFILFIYDYVRITILLESINNKVFESLMLPTIFLGWILLFPIWYLIKHIKQDKWKIIDTRRVIQNNADHDAYIISKELYDARKHEHDSFVSVQNSIIKSNKYNLQRRIENAWYCHKCDLLLWQTVELDGWEIAPG